ncbi:MAG: glycoside hydrolase family 36 N-terminal domain-containing protein [Clostridia bacterium]
MAAGDYRVPTCHIRHEDASTVTELEYVGYEVLEGKPGLEGLPHIYAEEPGEAETLQLTFYDRLAKVRCHPILYNLRRL